MISYTELLHLAFPEVIVVLTSILVIAVRVGVSSSKLARTAPSHT